MSHEVFVRDIIAIERAVTLPNCCPKCRTPFDLGTNNIKLWSLRPVFHQVRLTKVKVEGKDMDVFETTGTAPLPVQAGDWDRLPAIFKCGNCHHTLAKYHRRTWILEALDEKLAAQLRTLLYDSDVSDPEIKKKVWGIMGYQVSCRACNMEMELGTEEVPHPIDPRVHTCTRNMHELDTKR